MNNVIYDVILKRHNGSSRHNVCIFYDEDKELAIDAMANYCKKNGFSIIEKDGRFSIADIIIRKRKYTGEIISETSYHKIFDTVTGKRLRCVKSHDGIEYIKGCDKHKE